MKENSQMNQCPKCGSQKTEESEVRMTGGGLSSIMDMGTKKYKAITCKNCGYTEFYNEEHSTAEQIADLFFG